jgi:hypothetical protein
MMKTIIINKQTSPSFSLSLTSSYGNNHRVCQPRSSRVVCEYWKNLKLEIFNDR